MTARPFTVYIVLAFYACLFPLLAVKAQSPAPRSLFAQPGERCHNFCQNCGVEIWGTATRDGAVWDRHDCTPIQGLQRRVAALEAEVAAIRAKLAAR